MLWRFELAGLFIDKIDFNILPRAALTSAPRNKIIVKEFWKYKQDRNEILETTTEHY